MAVCGRNLGLEGALSLLLLLLLLLLLWPAGESENGQHQPSNCFFLCTVIRLALSLYLSTSCLTPSGDQRQKLAIRKFRDSAYPCRRIPIRSFQPVLQCVWRIGRGARRGTCPRHGARREGETKRCRKRYETLYTRHSRQEPRRGGGEEVRGGGGERRGENGRGARGSLPPHGCKHTCLHAASTCCS